MVMRETAFGVFASPVLAIVGLLLAACGDSERADGGRGTGSGGNGGASGAAGSGESGGASGAAGDSRGGSNGVGGAAGGSAMGGSGAIAGSGAGAGTAGAGGIGDAGGGGAGGEQESASFHWIDATEEHRERAASSTKPAFLRILMLPPYDAPALIGTSELIIGEHTEELYTEGIVWTEATGTIALGGLPGANPNLIFSPLSLPQAISADGSVVVGTARNSENRFAPFRWTRADGMEAIAEEGGAEAVSADGSVVLGWQSSPSRLFRWTRALGAMTIIEPLAGYAATEFLAMSDDGATVLGYSYRDEDNAQRMFVWTEGSGTRAVENLPGFEWCPVALSTVSRSSGVVSGSCYGETRDEPYVWAGQDRLVALGPADALGGYAPGSPVAATADGSSAFGGATNAADESRAYLWTEANGFELIALPEGETTSSPSPSRFAMSEDGSVVVGWLGGNPRRSFRWSEDAGAVVLSPLEGDDTSQVEVVSADGSIAAGSSCCGTGRSAAVYWRADGVPHGIADELEAEGVELGGNPLGHARSAHAPFGFFGRASKDEMSIDVAWRARLP